MTRHNLIKKAGEPDENSKAESLKEEETKAYCRLSGINLESQIQRDSVIFYEQNSFYSFKSSIFEKYPRPKKSEVWGQLHD